MSRGRTKTTGSPGRTTGSLESSRNDGKRQVKRPWSDEERAAVLRHLQTFIWLKKLPGKAAIDKCIESEGALGNRSWRNVKDFCRNLIDKS